MTEWFFFSFLSDVGTTTIINKKMDAGYPTRKFLSQITFLTENREQLHIQIHFCLIKKNYRCGNVTVILFLEYFNFNIYKHKFVLCFSRNLCKVFNKLPNLNLHLLSASIFEIIEITIVLEMGRCLM